MTDLINQEKVENEAQQDEISKLRKSKNNPLPLNELLELIEELTAQMNEAAQNLQFEIAARYRDEISDLRKELRAMREAMGTE
ncbi:MAG: UvrB/UvrC motif-containing protein [Candidatus Nanopelagicales bacterium]